MDDNDNVIYDHWRFPRRVLNRIKYLERRKRRLQSIMDHKSNCNEILYGNTYKKSKNYYKVIKKFRITCKKITDIKLNWRRQVCNKLAKKYKVICMDVASCPTEDTHKENKLPKCVWKKVNVANRLHAISYIPQLMDTDVAKYGGLLLDSPEDSTRTCSFCGRKNKPLKLGKRIFTCK